MTLRTPLLSVVVDPKYTTEESHKITSKMNFSNIHSGFLYEIMLDFSGDSYAMLRRVNTGLKERITPSKIDTISHKQYSYYMTYLQWQIDKWPGYITKNANELKDTLTPFFSITNRQNRNNLSDALLNANFNAINHGVAVANDLLSKLTLDYRQGCAREASCVLTPICCMTFLTLGACIPSPTSCIGYISNPFTISAFPSSCGTFAAIVGIEYYLPLNACRPSSLKNADNAIKKFTQDSKLSIIANSNLRITQLNKVKFKKDRFGAFLFFKESTKIKHDEKLVFSNQTNAKIAEFLGCKDLPGNKKFTS